MMFSLGCIQALKCNSNTCPTGITTQKPELKGGLDVPTKSARAAAFHKSTVHAGTAAFDLHANAPGGSYC